MRIHRAVALAAHLSVVACTQLIGGCINDTDTIDNQGTPGRATIEIRFHDTYDKAGTRADVSDIRVDIIDAASDQPILLGLALTRDTAGSWHGSIPFLPGSTPLRFTARAYDIDAIEIFSGSTELALTIDNQSVEIPLAPTQDQNTYDIPRLYRIAYPTEVVAGHEAAIVFSCQGNAGQTITWHVASDDGSSPFAPAQGTLTLTGTVADFVVLYTAPEVTSTSAFDHRVTITADQESSAVAIATSFATTVVPTAPGADVVANTRPSVLFNPVIRQIVADGTSNPGEVALTADVSDDGDPAALAYHWSYAPNTGTAPALFASSGTVNPAHLQGYTLDHQGTISLAVTDASGGTTTVHYQLIPEQFADVVEHDAVNSIRDIVAGAEHTCVLTGASAVRCWGDSQYGQLGHGNAQDIGDHPDRQPYLYGDVPLPAADPVAQLVAGDHHTCARLQSGLVMCWGRNHAGQLGYATTDHLGDGEPVTSFGYVNLGGPARHIAAGGNHTCAILNSDAVRCWGQNDFGQLGHGHVDAIGDDENVFNAGDITPGADIGVSVTVEALALGSHHTCALLSTGAARCWGRNDWGQLGRSNTDDLGDDEPLTALADIQLPGPVRKLVAGERHTCALLHSGALRCWGNTDDGQLGYGSSTGSYGDQAGETPFALTDIEVAASVSTTVIDVAAGGRHTCALLSDGQLKCWGAGSYGQLGYSDFSERTSPADHGVDLDGASAYRLTAGTDHTCALRVTGAARCWGHGGSGRLGYGLPLHIVSPAQVSDVPVFEAGATDLLYATSCRELLAQEPTSGDGIYVIDPDDTGPMEPFYSYCDMTTDGGGWTLVMSVRGRLAGTGQVNIYSLADRSANAKATDAAIRLIASQGQRELLIVRGSTRYIERYSAGEWSTWASNGARNLRYDVKVANGTWRNNACNGHYNNRGVSTYSDLHAATCPHVYSGGRVYMTQNHTSYGSAINPPFAVSVR